MTLENLIKDFIESLQKSLSRKQAVQVTKNALVRQVKQHNKVVFEQDGNKYEFTESELKEVWSSIK